METSKVPSFAGEGKIVQVLRSEKWSLFPLTRTLILKWNFYYHFIAISFYVDRKYNVSSCLFFSQIPHITRISFDFAKMYLLEKYLVVCLSTQIWFPSPSLCGTVVKRERKTKQPSLSAAFAKFLLLINQRRLCSWDREKLIKEMFLLNQKAKVATAKVSEKNVMSLKVSTCQILRKQKFICRKKPETVWFILR